MPIAAALRALDRDAPSLEIIVKWSAPRTTSKWTRHLPPPPTGSEAASFAAARNLAYGKAIIEAEKEQVQLINLLPQLGPRFS